MRNFLRQLTRFQAKNSQSGFTIIEAVVSAGVFAFVVASSLAVYLVTIQLDSRTRAERAVQQNARFIMDYIGKEIRNGSIDYAGTNDINTLTLINQQNQTEIFESGGDNLEFTRGSLGTTNLNSDGVRVTRFNAYLYPDVNPFDLDNDTHLQPHVTIVMRLESQTLKDVERGTIDVQSTFAVREYPSRQ
jgi:type II secretory pathway pseudopilin PulG